MRLVHVSDLHFGHHDPAVAAGLAADIATQAPDLVVASGDFTQRGTASEFALAGTFLAQLRAPVFAVPGNHDLGRNLIRRFLDPYGLYRRYVAPEIEPFVELGAPSERVALAGLNTTRRALLDRDWSNGSISEAQLDRLARTFERAAPDSLRIVVAHHPLMRPAGPTQQPTRAVRRSALALEAFARLKVRLVLSGHFHLSFVRRYDGIHTGEGILPGPREAAVAPVLVAQASSAISDRLRGQPNSYNVIDVQGGEIAIRAREWRSDHWVTADRALAAA